jgi:lysophospholipase L1-like esterase
MQTYRLNRVLAGLTLLTAANAMAAPTIYTVGDSTVQSYTAGYYPRAGWGQELGWHFDPAKVAVTNKAVGGTSSKSFYDSYWAGVKSLVKPGDYVTIGFGINDAAADAARHTVPFTTFKEYLTRFVNETRALGAYPILVATQPRNAWNAGPNPTVYPAYHDYPVASRQLAGELGVPLIDLDQRGVALLQSLGQSYATNYLYNYYLPGEWTNYPNGNADAVHFQQNGAHELARLVVAGIRSLAGDVNVGKLIPALKPTYQVNFSSNNAAGGQISRAASFPAGATVTAYARPYAGFAFVSWNGDITSTRRNATFTMGSVPRTVSATFSGSPASYQAEGAVLSGTGTVTETVNAGYTGSSYVNFPLTGGTLTFNNANGGDGGARTLRVRYALGGTTARTGQLVVNGVASAVTLNPTGAFSSWVVDEIAVTLTAGSTNTIAFRSTGADLANIDEMTVR